MTTVRPYQEFAPPYGFRNLLSRQLERLGCRESGRRRNRILGVTLVLLSPAALVFIGSLGLSAALALMFALMLAGVSLPSLLCRLSFTGPDAFRFRLMLTPEPGATGIAIVMEGGSEPAATCVLSDGEWRIRKRFWRLATPLFLPKVLGLVATAWRRERGEPFVYRLRGEERGRALGLACLGHLVARLAARGCRVEKTAPVLPAPPVVLCAIGWMIVVVAFRDFGGDRGYVVERLFSYGRIVLGLIVAWIAFAPWITALRVEGDGGRFDLTDEIAGPVYRIDGPGPKPVEIDYEELLDEHLGLRRADLLEAAVDEMLQTASTADIGAPSA